MAVAAEDDRRLPVDPDLAGGVRGDEAWAWSRLSDLARRSARRIVSRGVTGFEAADVAQRALLRLREGGLRDYRGSTNVALAAFVHKCVRTTALGMLRVERRRSDRERRWYSMLPSSTDGSEPSIEIVSLLRRLDEAHPRSRCARILAQAYFYATPYRELAEEFGVSVGAMRKRVFECKRRARELAS